jgi:hypothetical protein
MLLLLKCVSILPLKHVWTDDPDHLRGEIRPNPEKERRGKGRREREEEEGGGGVFGVLPE